MDDEKISKIEKLSISTIEIDLQDIINNKEFKRKEIENVIINSTVGKYWVYNKYVEKEESKINKEMTIKKEKLEKILKEQLAKNEVMKQIIIKDIKEFNFNSWNPKYSRELLKNTEFTRILTEMKLNSQNIPYIFNIPVEGEYAFDCHRIFWQMRIYFKFIYGKIGKTISLYYIMRCINYNSFIPIKHDFKGRDKKIINKVGLPTAYNAVKGYIDYLLYVGILKSIYETNEISYREDLEIVNYNNLDVQQKHLKYKHNKSKELPCYKCGELTNEIFKKHKINTCICKSCIIDEIEELNVDVKDLEYYN